VHEHPGHLLAELSARAELVVLGQHAGETSLSPGIGAVTHAVLNHAQGPRRVRACRAIGARVGDAWPERHCDGNPRAAERIKASATSEEIRR
jgi:hypothetical protein